MKQQHHWLDSPEAKAAFDQVLSDLLPESDRGAVTIAADMISNHLDRFFVDLCPDFLRSKLKQIIKYPGPAGSLSGKADIAALNGWIDHRVYQSIELLRRIRNEAAHSDRSFRLRDHTDRLNGMLDLGENVPAALHNMAGELLLVNLFYQLKGSGEKLAEDLGENPFDTIEKIAKELEKRPGWSEALEERVPRLKLGLGVSLLISLMTLAREKNLANLTAGRRGPNEGGLAPELGAAVVEPTPSE